jgi:hypothetical protein
VRVVVAHSEDVDTGAAVAEVLSQCDAKLGDGPPPSAGLLYAPATADHSLLLKSVGERFPGIALIGCSTDATATSVLAFKEESTSLTLFCSETITFGAAVARDIAKDPVGSTERAVREAVEALGGADPALCILLPEALAANAVRMVEGARRGLGSNAVPVVGGLATDGWKGEWTYQYFGSELLSGTVPVLVFGGKLLASHGVATGWNPVGRRCCVTRVEGNLLFEIDGKPALEFYRHYLGAHGGPSREHPLVVFEEEGGAPSYLRAPMAYDEDSGSVSFAGDIPLGALVQLSETSREDVLKACESSVGQALESYPGSSPQAALFFSCAARQIMLGTHTAREFEILAKSAGDMSISGMYALGEIGPHRIGGRSQFHNVTFVSLILGTS